MFKITQNYPYIHKILKINESGPAPTRPRSQKNKTTGQLSPAKIFPMNKNIDNFLVALELFPNGYVINVQGDAETPFNNINLKVYDYDNFKKR